MGRFRTGVEGEGILGKKIIGQSLKKSRVPGVFSSFCSASGLFLFAESPEARSLGFRSAGFSSLCLQFFSKLRGH